MLLRRYREQVKPAEEEKVVPETSKKEEPAEKPKAKGTRKK